MGLDFLDQRIHEWVDFLFGFTGESLFRLVMAAVAGGLVGVEREMRGREAGFRTNLLVALGSALVMIVSIKLTQQNWQAFGGYNINVDPGRIAYGVMTGIGFLGAGAIVKGGAGVKGLTTSAALWCVAALGLCAGMGLYMLTLFACGLVILALWVLDYFENRLPRRHYREVKLRAPWTPTQIHDRVQLFQQAGIELVDHDFQRGPDLAQIDVHLWVSYVERGRFDEFLKRLESEPGVMLLSSVKG